MHVYIFLRLLLSFRVTTVQKPENAGKEKQDLEQV
jgi:hypothetical protein